MTGGEVAVALFWVPLFSCLLQTMVSIYAVDFLSADTLPQGLGLREPYNASLKWSIHSLPAFSSSSYFTAADGQATMLCFQSTLIQCLVPHKGQSTTAFLCHPVCLTSSWGPCADLWCIRRELKLCAWRFAAWLLSFLFSSCVKGFASLRYCTFRQEMIDCNHLNNELRHFRISSCKKAGGGRSVHKSSISHREDEGKTLSAVCWLTLVLQVCVIVSWVAVTLSGSFDWTWEFVTLYRVPYQCGVCEDWLSRTKCETAKNQWKIRHEIQQKYFWKGLPMLQPMTSLQLWVWACHLCYVLHMLHRCLVSCNAAWHMLALVWAYCILWTSVSYYMYKSLCFYRNERFI